MAGQNLSALVSTEQLRRIPATGSPVGTVAVLDLGVKSSTLRYLTARGLEVILVPQSISSVELLALAPDSVFFSNGPGDPGASDRHVELLQDVLRAGIPFFGICFGNQLLGRALGFDTYKLPFGHRGINQPVLDRATGKTEITAHNHGFAVSAPIEGATQSPAGFGRVEVSHINLNDNVVEGLRALDIPAFSVQYHPEAAAGPHDANYLFDRFRDLVAEKKVQH
jgi:carbamoyl-phosphate synthase small subunit